MSILPPWIGDKKCDKYSHTLGARGANAMFRQRSFERSVMSGTVSDLVNINIKAPSCLIVVHVERNMNSWKTVVADKWNIIILSMASWLQTMFKSHGYRYVPRLPRCDTPCDGHFFLGIRVTKTSCKLLATRELLRNGPWGSLGNQGTCLSLLFFIFWDPSVVFKYHKYLRREFSHWWTFPWLFFWPRLC